jgi:integrase
MRDVAEVEPTAVKRRTEFAVLSPAEVEAVARKAADELTRVAILVAAFTGLRLSELRGLRWRDVDFQNRLIHVRRKHFGAKDAPEGRPKSGIARSVPLIDLAARALDELSRRDDFTGAGDLGAVVDAELSEASSLPARYPDTMTADGKDG